MYDIIFYEDRNGYSEIRSLLKVLEKDSLQKRHKKLQEEKLNVQNGI